MLTSASGSSSRSVLMTWTARWLDMHPTRTSLRPAYLMPSRRSSSKAGSRDRDRASTQAPSAVGLAPSRPRSNRALPNIDSMRRSWAARDGWEVFSAAAALEMLPWSAIAQTARR